MNIDAAIIFITLLLLLNNYQDTILHSFKHAPLARPYITNIPYIYLVLFERQIYAYIFQKTVLIRVALWINIQLTRDRLPRSTTTSLSHDAR